MRISIVAAKFNQEFTDALVENVVEEIDSFDVNARVDLVRVPGAFEIPVVCKAIIEAEAPDCVIALGCIIRGGTGHADLVASRVNIEVVDLDRLFRVGWLVRFAPSSKNGTCSCLKDLRAERFGDVVISAEFQALDNIILFAFGCQPGISNPRYPS